MAGKKFNKIRLLSRTKLSIYTQGTVLHENVKTLQYNFPFHILFLTQHVPLFPLDKYVNLYIFIPTHVRGLPVHTFFMESIKLLIDDQNFQSLLLGKTKY